MIDGRKDNIDKLELFKFQGRKWMLGLISRNKNVFQPLFLICRWDSSIKLYELSFSAIICFSQFIW